MHSPSVINSFGYSGGVFLGLCAIPQLYVMWKNRSAKDVSMLWILCYTIGLVLTMTYMIMLNAWAGVIPIIVQIVLAIIVFISKLLMDYGVIKPKIISDKEHTGDAFETKAQLTAQLS
ncbi:expressed protein [Batrachochytrium dendrobatidis JAM81]|uniref:Expressed protein n=1 Tax=Batrachochytrium dendrobatidis (strain JAM81 / FGSC 10211) TaxID=684364 RepID=F4P0Q1_BATDJ|nr:uncharacterized protein BATDEDRAFT_87572 [Batrachochytrium dendrobatidis JAM81]EGF81318.1 expressed protein [Batrachochytrium dendrobatidis JAM81]KAJ8329630.1 hypothetical protein O5D80_002197 [Batrachochytrium dendrobatidis]KAK5669525.1 hypothetical protein QVD99_003919 [Batrachochytrium dendrobatidis]|eukprot:XP_006678169.1 expressed protein [Batrachochytrium dendrobatidis JAM81]